MAGGGELAGVDRAGRLQTLRAADHLPAFLSLRYEKRREELERLIADPTSDYFSEDPEVACDILEDQGNSGQSCCRR